MERKINLADLKTELAVTTSMNEHNIKILEKVGLDESTGYWWLRFSFDYKLENGIVVILTNFKHDSTGTTWTLEIEKCHYLRISKKEDRISFDIVETLINITELKRLQQLSHERLRDYLGSNVVPLITKKIRYTKYKPQFRFFLSHKAKDKPILRTFKNGLAFLGYPTWLDESDMPYGYLQPALKASIEECDCFIAWLNEEYFNSDYCTEELLYAKQLGKIILPFGVFGEIKTRLRADENLKFLERLLIDNPDEKSFFEVLRRIDSTLSNFEMIALPSC
ncbi:uncharacterized protein LOC114519108 [Dendronephthya gigantea]|uniref:uncharacterized protein LOC114519108 n=1 Tax=Dendronephthya gigantea TaxID=151771 RepID=UPI00106A3C8D|nr:uncharacterized protein LOC114519108 [Dendronephthya gigantea]